MSDDAMFRRAQTLVRDAPQSLTYDAWNMVWSVWYATTQWTGDVFPSGAGGETKDAVIRLDL